MEKLYYKDSYIKDFTAEVVEVVEKDGKYHVCLDKTAFFPGGGGQFNDIGHIENQEVVDVYELDNKIYHVLNRKLIKIHKVKCSIDWSRREDGMHQHFGQHVLSGCFYTLLKKNTVGFHLGKEFSTVDIEGILTQEEINRVEAYANDIISQNIKVETLTPTKRELKKIWIRRDLPTTTDEIRIVKIGDLDSNACCGVHPISTVDLRMIKIKRFEKNRNATRIEFLAGSRAINHCLRRDNYLTDICRYLCSKEDEAIDGVKRLHDKVEDINKSNKKLEEIIASYEIKEMIDSALKVNNVSIIRKIYKDKNVKYVSRVASNMTESDNVISLLCCINEDKVNLIFASSKNLNNVNMGSLLKDSVTLIDGKGGGSNHLAQGGGKNNSNLEACLDYACSKLQRSL